MNGVNKRFNVKLKNIEKVEELLQEVYILATNQINQIQEEITIIKNSIPLKDSDIDTKEKYGKTINNYLLTLQKAIDKKFEIAKFMGEVIKYNGNISDALNDASFAKTSKLELDKIRQTVKEINDNNNPEKYELKR